MSRAQFFTTAFSKVNMHRYKAPIHAIKKETWVTTDASHEDANSVDPEVYPEGYKYIIQLVVQDDDISNFKEPPSTDAFKDIT
eukprot:12521225-Ditylum_brightwellii.AAC.1